MGPEKRLVIKTDVYTVIQKKNTFQERERTANEHSAYKPSAGERLAGEAPLQFAARSKE